MANPSSSNLEKTMITSPKSKVGSKIQIKNTRGMNGATSGFATVGARGSLNKTGEDPVRVQRELDDTNSATVGEFESSDTIEEDDIDKRKVFKVLEGKYLKELNDSEYIDYYVKNKMEYNDEQFGFLRSDKKVTLERDFRSVNEELLQFLMIAKKEKVPIECWPTPRDDMTNHIIANNGLEVWHKKMKLFKDKAIQKALKSKPFVFEGETFNGDGKAQVLLHSIWGSSCNAAANTAGEPHYTHHNYRTSLVVDLLASDLKTQVFSEKSAFLTGFFTTPESSPLSDNLCYWKPQLSGDKSRTTVSLMVFKDNSSSLKAKSFATAAIVWAAVSKAYYDGEEYPFFGCQQEHRVGMATKVGDNAPCCKMMNLLARDKSHAEGPFASAIDLGNKENWIENMDNSRTEAKLATEHAIAAKDKAKLATKNAKAASVKSNAKAANAKAANAKAANAKAVRFKSKATPVKHQR